MKHLIACLSVLCALVALSGPALGKSITISVPINQVGVHTGDRGTFYVVNVPIPGDIEGKRLDSVFLEFAVDATPLVED